MPKINILSPFVADLIAAGEVVERPASAVKELIENSFDAGAKNITVEIRSGGAEYIRVTDDGCGMEPEDAGVAFLRHATSKLTDERGLESIGTFGFRGEALAAIASVSHVELLTCPHGARTGTRLTLDAGDIGEMHEAGCPEGTTIIIRGLFFNTPARLKFLKSDRAEGTACVQAALRCALGRPDVSVRCIKDGQEQFFTPGDGRIQSAVYSLLGRETASTMTEVHSEEETPVGVSGFVSSPGGGRGSRSAQFFFCNGRAIKSQILQAAVEQAYKNSLLVGRFPACVIYLTISAASVDVNVHPAKTEVKFSEEKKVFDAVYYTVLGALEAPETPVREEPKLPEPRQYESVSVKGSAGSERKYAPVYRPSENTARTGVLRSPQVEYQTYIEPPRPAFSSPARQEIKTPAPEPRAPEEPVRVIGEALGLYILAQRGDELIIIDKHAVHERILFDRLVKTPGEVMSQTLLSPELFRADDALAEVIERNSELIRELGFELDAYGERDYIIRAVPEGVEPSDAASAVEELLRSLAETKIPDAKAVRENALKTVACRAAIKAGRSSEPRELQRLAEAVCSGEVRCCPHGRPVSWTLTRKELDKQFKRIV